MPHKFCTFLLKFFIRFVFGNCKLITPINNLAIPVASSRNVFVKSRKKFATPYKNQTLLKKLQFTKKSVAK